MSVTRLLTVALCATAITGCARSNLKTEFHVSVNALAAAGIESTRRYILVPGKQGITTQDLQFQEFASYLHRALASQGFSRADENANADVVIVVAYSVGEPEQRTFTYMIPHFGQTGISSATTYGTANTYGTLNTYGARGLYSGTTSYSGTTHYQPSYGITGYSAGVGTLVTYTRTLGLVAFDAASMRSGQEPKELWRTSAVSAGRSADLRLVFPYLVAAARPYLGTATQGRAVDVVFEEDDDRVAQIRGDRAELAEDKLRHN